MKAPSTSLWETAIENLISTMNEWTHFKNKRCKTTSDRATEILKTVLDRGGVDVYGGMENGK